MSTLLSDIEVTVRRQLTETTASYWSSAELIDIEIRGIKDLWRDIADLKQEHFLTIDATNVTLSASTSTLSGVPSDVHKVYLLEPRNISSTSSNVGLSFVPRDYNSPEFQTARSKDAVSPSNEVLCYAVHQAGSPVAAPTILVAPQVTSAVNLTLCYVPTLAAMTSSSTVPIPGEADNAIVAWTVAYAMAKENESRTPDPMWLQVYATEKQHLLQSLGNRQYQENSFVGAVFEEYWS